MELIIDFFTIGQKPDCRLNCLMHGAGSSVNSAICEDMSKFCQGFRMVVCEKYTAQLYFKLVRA